jgi:hypothetical protein
MWSHATEFDGDVTIEEVEEVQRRLVDIQERGRIVQRSLEAMQKRLAGMHPSTTWEALNEFDDVGMEETIGFQNEGNRGNDQIDTMVGKCYCYSHDCKLFSSPCQCHGLHFGIISFQISFKTRKQLQ